jgi:hypothetical protein
MSDDLHSGLKTTILADVTHGSTRFLLVRLQSGKDRFVDTVHARPQSYSTYGLQSTDFLRILGFRRAACAFHQGECYCRVVDTGSDLGKYGQALAEALDLMQRAGTHLERCGLFLPQLEGWGYFYGRPSQEGRRPNRHRCTGNGHVAPKIERMKRAEDEFFRFAFTWIDGGADKGWVTHYRARHMPLAPKFQAALNFLGDFSWFEECPEYDFDGCWWRFTAYQNRGDSIFDGNAEQTHQQFDAHAANFSPGLQLLLASDGKVAPLGLSFLVQEHVVRTPDLGRPTVPTGAPARVQQQYKYDVAFSFAGTQRELAEDIAKQVRAAGFDVFYDNFYPEQLWGEDLAALFDRIYRKESRFCVMLISNEYANRIWTTAERRSATARAIAERGNAYILPIRIDAVDIDGLPPTLGYLPGKEMSASQIAEILITKLRA